MKANVAGVKNVPGKAVTLDLAAQEGRIPEKTEIDFLALVKFSGTVENTGKTLAFNGRLSTVVELECSRCAEKVPYQVDVPFYEVYSNQPEVLLQDNEEEIHLYEGDEIDIFPQVVQSIQLELPMKVLCREECRGLCPVCGVNLNEGQCRCAGESVDPRLLALKKLLDNSSTEGGVINGSTEKKNL